MVNVSVSSRDKTGLLEHLYVCGYDDDNSALAPPPVQSGNGPYQSVTVRTATWKTTKGESREVVGLNPLTKLRGSILGRTLTAQGARCQGASHDPIRPISICTYVTTFPRWGIALSATGVVLAHRPVTLPEKTYWKSTYLKSPRGKEHRLASLLVHTQLTDLTTYT